MSPIRSAALAAALRAPHARALHSSAGAAAPPAITPDSKCVACEGLAEALPADEVKAQAGALLPTWRTNDDHTWLLKSVKVRNFSAALDYINRIGQIAEAEQHHPDLAIRSYNFVDIALQTHKVGGITDNDLILAVKIDTVPFEPPRQKGRQAQ